MGSAGGLHSLHLLCHLALPAHCTHRRWRRLRSLRSLRCLQIREDLRPLMVQHADLCCLLVSGLLLLLLLLPVLLLLLSLSHLSSRKPRKLCFTWVSSRFPASIHIPNHRETARVIWRPAAWSAMEFALHARCVGSARSLRSLRPRCPLRGLRSLRSLRPLLGSRRPNTGPPKTESAKNSSTSRQVLQLTQPVQT